LEFPSDESPASYRIFHTNGQLMHEGLIENANLGREELNLRGLLEPGLYLLEYRSARGQNRIRFLVQ